MATTAYVQLKLCSKSADEDFLKWLLVWTLEGLAWFCSRLCGVGLLMAKRSQDQKGKGFPHGGDQYLS